MVAGNPRASNRRNLSVIGMIALVLSIISVSLGLVCLGLTVFLMRQIPPKRITDSTGFQQLWRLHTHILSGHKCSSIVTNNGELIRQILPKGSTNEHIADNLSFWMRHHGNMNIYTDWDANSLYASALSSISGFATTCKTTLGL